MASDSPDLGSLSQAARGKQLRTARGILLFIGVLTVVANGIFFAIAESQVDKALDEEVQQARRQGMMVDQVKLKEIRADAIRFVKLLQGVGIALGVVFIIFGFLVYSYPVPITITSLILYIGAGAVFGAIDPGTLLQGIIIKIIIIVALAKSIQAALAYERERQASAMQTNFPGGGFGQEPI